MEYVGSKHTGIKQLFMKAVYLFTCLPLWMKLLYIVL